jgi:twinkle protein
MKTWGDFKIQIPLGNGPELVTTCPECSPHRKKKNAKCLSVNIEKAVWYCAHCGWAGTLKAGVEKRSERIDLTPEYVKPTWQDRPADDKLRLVLAERHIPLDVAMRARLQVDRAWFPAQEDWADAVQFPYLRGGEVVNIKSRCITQKDFRQVAKAEKILYGLDDIDHERVVIVEGEWDKLAFAAAGVWSCVSVPDGAPAKNARPSEKKFEFLANCEAQLRDVKLYVIATDADDPGQALAEELARRLGTERCARLAWPSGCKDANDFLRQEGAAALAKWLERAKPWPIDEVKTTAEMADELMRFYMHGEQRGVLTGWSNLDELYTVGTGQLTVITGVPSHGKSEFLDALMVNLAEQHGWVFAVCSPENLPVSRHVAKLAEKHMRKPFFPGIQERMTPTEFASALEWLHQHFFWIVPEESMPIETVLVKTRALIFRHGVKGLVIDPWNEFEHKRPGNLTETEYVSDMLGKITRFARRNGVHIWLVAHPSKLYRRDDGTYPVPTPYDISGSAHWRNKATNCLCVWRDEVDGESTRVEVHVQKVRFKSFGRQGMAMFEWDRATGRYRSAEHLGATYVDAD